MSEIHKPLKCTLLIDDDHITNFINSKLITRLGISEEIHCFTNSKASLDFIMNYGSLNNQCSPDLILLDINMPGIDGFEFLELFKAVKFNNQNDVKVIFLSTSTDPRDVDRIKNEFKSTSVHKPLTHEKLRNALKEFSIII